MIFFKTMSDETIIRFNFCDIWNNQGLGKCYHLRPIILHPTKSLKHVFNLSVPRYSFLYHTSRVRLVRSGMGSCIFRGCRSMYRPISRSTVDRHIGRYVGRESTEYRRSAGREFFEYRSRACRVSTDMLAPLGRYSLSVDSWSIVGRYFADGSCTFTGESFLSRIP